MCQHAISSPVRQPSRFRPASSRASVPAPCRRGRPAARAGARRRVGVSPATVARAYQELRQRGLLATAGRHGTRVRPRPPVAARRSALRPHRCPVPGTCPGEPDARLLPRSVRTWRRSPPTPARRSATPTPECCPSWRRWPAPG
ncbi:hypothetical protein NKG94_24740 [Micromonospora sp. M12]